MTQPAIFQGPKDPALLNWNTANLLDNNANLFGELSAISSLHQGVKWTYTDLQSKSKELAARLVQNGIRPGDRIFLLAGNSVEFIQIFFATTAIGAIVSLGNPIFSAVEFGEAIEAVEPRCVFISQKIGFRNNAALIDHATKNVKKGSVVILGGTGASIPESCISFDELLTGSTSIEQQDVLTLEDFWGKSPASAPCCFQFTSGTTGKRKASMLSHANLINNANLVGYQLQLSNSDTLCCCPPLSHCFGLVCGLLASCLHGSTLIMPSEIFNPSLSLQGLRNEACTVLHAVPSMFEALLVQEKKQRVNGASDYSLRTGIIAGSTPPIDLLCSIRESLGLKSMLYPFGMTELSAVCLCTSIGDSLIADNTSVGRAMPHTKVKVINGSGEVLPIDSPGELCVSGYLVHLGYFRNKEKSEEALHTDSSGEQWLRTGDLASLDQTGRCRIIGRSKDMIKRHGENIAPKDIEDLLLAHPGVSRTAVVGVPHRKYGEAVVAFVELNSRSLLDEQDLKGWLRKKKLSPHKMPDYFFPVGDTEDALTEIPLNTSGKVLKTELRVVALEFLNRLAVK
ncbi:putative amp dependent CoA ligase [Camillea tinctor]|nr:putative amp dependent CoA ligase [Camillea tinctor]